jgi:hypothetical protein
LVGGDWREVPSALTVGGRTYDVIWANAPAGATQKVATGQELDTGLARALERHGRDYGIAVDFWNRKLTAKATYYETTDVGNVAEYGSITLFQNTNVRIVDAFEPVLVGMGRPVPQNEWVETRADLTRTFNAAAAEIESTGYELSAIANPLPNLRVTVNYPYTNRAVTNLISPTLRAHGPAKALEGSAGLPTQRHQHLR